MRFVDGGNKIRLFVYPSAHMRHAVHAESLSSQRVAKSSMLKPVSGQKIAIEETLALMLVNDHVVLTERSVEPSAGLGARGVNGSLLIHYTPFFLI